MKKKKNIIITIVVTAILLVGGAVAYYISQDKKAPQAADDNGQSQEQRVVDVPEEPSLTGSLTDAVEGKTSKQAIEYVDTLVKKGELPKEKANEYKSQVSQEVGDKASAIKYAEASYREDKADTEKAKYLIIVYANNNKQSEAQKLYDTTVKSLDKTASDYENAKHEIDYIARAHQLKVKE